VICRSLRGCLNMKIQTFILITFFILLHFELAGGNIWRRSKYVLSAHKVPYVRKLNVEYLSNEKGLDLEYSMGVVSIS
jgi:hypothetical protein